MALERWHMQIREKQGVAPRPTFYVSDPDPVPGTKGVTVRYLSVQDGDDHGLEPGTYVQTNVRTDAYNELRELRTRITSHVTFSMMDKSKSPTSRKGPELDILNTIRFVQAAETSNGAVVLKLVPATPSEVEEMMKGINAGQIRGTFTLHPKQ